MDLYALLKVLHVIGAAILFGTGLGIAFFLFRAARRETPACVAATLRSVVVADYLFTAMAVIAQPVTGFLLAYLGGHSLGQTWILASLLLYALVGACWLPVVAIQIKMRTLAELAAAGGEASLPPEFHRLYRIWFWLGWPAFLAVLAIFWLMIAKPA